MRYTVRLRPSAQRELDKLAEPVYQRIHAALERLAEDPRPHGMKKLIGEDAYRIRVGSYRIVYEIQDDILLVFVVRIRHRREAY